MKTSLVLAATLVGLVASHGDDHGGQHIPKILGGRKFLSDIKLRQPAPLPEPIGPRIESRSERRQTGGKRQIDDNIDGRCGPGAGSCADGYCCSAEGWCGKGIYYCSAPDCQINYATACDGNQKPWGLDTSQVARPKVGNVLYGGAGIYECKKAGDIALTFDDGPYKYTNDLLDKLRSYGAKATFFITGNNIGKGHINDPATEYPAIIRRMYNEGHQIASHTWSHENATKMTNTQFRNQMIWNEIAINSLMGFFPTYMRPPYSICEKNCQTILAELGYHTIYFDLDTAGYLNDTPKDIQNSKDIWDKAMRTSNPSKNKYLQIEHDIQTQVVYNLTDYILTSLYANGYQSVTVGECLGDPEANWYRAGPAGSVGQAPSSYVQPTTARSTTSIRTAITTRSTIPATATLPSGPSTDGTCGHGVTCAGTRFGACCSPFGYCGTGDDYCQISWGCQPEFGSCAGSVSDDPDEPVYEEEQPPPIEEEEPEVVLPTPGGAGGLPVSTDGRCGAEVGRTCLGSAAGDCCNLYNECSSNLVYCLGVLGCQTGYGSCVLE
ncbi:hypothetical protein QBC39DRAFT_394045 [Podospora conica]|nr:hypothetical protein QBC39DRAFT_394045 [Schizothecium conicum]